jgi:hypothetical protein
MLLVPDDLARAISTGKYTLAVPAALNNPEVLAVIQIRILDAARTREAEFARIGTGYLLGEELDVYEHDNVLFRRSVAITGPWCDAPYSNNDCTTEG